MLQYGYTAAACDDTDGPRNMPCRSGNTLSALPFESGHSFAFPSSCSLLAPPSSQRAPYFLANSPARLSAKGHAEGSNPVCELAVVDTYV